MGRPGAACTRRRVTGRTDLRASLLLRPAEPAAPRPSWSWCDDSRTKGLARGLARTTKQKPWRPFPAVWVLRRLEKQPLFNSRSSFELNPAGYILQGSKRRSYQNGEPQAGKNLSFAPTVSWCGCTRVLVEANENANSQHRPLPHRCGPKQVLHLVSLDHGRRLSSSPGRVVP
jgi:hypothetical protein